MLTNILASVDSFPDLTLKSSELQWHCFLQGAGLLGLFGCVLLKESGYENVYCSEVNESRLSLVKDFGGIPVSLDQSTHLVEDESVDLVIEV